MAIIEEVTEHADDKGSTVVVDGEVKKDASVYVDTTTSDNVDPQLKDTWWLIKDAQGFGSITVTLLVVAFVVSTLAYVVSFTAPFFGFVIPFDAGATGSYLIPVLTLYGARRWTIAKYGS